MTNTELEKFLEVVNGTFPKMLEWWEIYKQVFSNLKKAFEDESVTLEEVEKILVDWSVGTNLDGVPAGYVKESFSANLLNAVREERARKSAHESKKNCCLDILGDCQDLPIRSKVPNKGPLVGRMVAEFQRLRDLKLSQGVATI